VVVSNILYFHPDPWGFMIPFDEHIFQMGWFNRPTSYSGTILGAASPPAACPERHFSKPQVVTLDEPTAGGFRRSSLPVKRFLLYVFLLRSERILYMGVSKNRGTPKWTVYNGKPY